MTEAENGERKEFQIIFDYLKFSRRERERKEKERKDLKEKKETQINVEKSRCILKVQRLTY